MLYYIHTQTTEHKTMFLTMPTYKHYYDEAIASGMLQVWHPSLTGVWEDDRADYISTVDGMIAARGQTVRNITPPHAT